MRLVRATLWVALGSWVGLVAAAAIVKRALPSRGDVGSDEVALVAVFDGVTLTSRSSAFRGGSILSWFGGSVVDLRDAALAPDARLNVLAFLGGISIRVPPGWKIVSGVRAFAGGVDIRTPASDDPAGPTLTLEGLAVLGGIEVSGKAPPAAPES